MSFSNGICFIRFDRKCHVEITSRKATFVQSRVHYDTGDSREHVEKRKKDKSHDVSMMLGFEGKLQ